MGIYCGWLRNQQFIGGKYPIIYRLWTISSIHSWRLGMGPRPICRGEMMTKHCILHGLLIRLSYAILKESQLVFRFFMFHVMEKSYEWLTGACFLRRQFSQSSQSSPYISCEMILENTVNNTKYGAPKRCWYRQTEKICIAGLVNCYITNWKDPPFYSWKRSNYFDWAMASIANC